MAAKLETVEVDADLSGEATVRAYTLLYADNEPVRVVATLSVACRLLTRTVGDSKSGGIGLDSDSF